MKVYYNEIDPFCCAWLRELMCRGLVPEGEIDGRSIEDVRPDELKEFTQCHFFAGIGGWAYALRVAAWPADKPVWTGSCPCQPFSAAGRGKGTFDERHLWPAFFHLIRQCGPDTIIGEQVASKAALTWWDVVQSDLEGAGYACGVSDTCAAGFGAPHIRQRLYWVALPQSEGLQGQPEPEGNPQGWQEQAGCIVDSGDVTGGLGAVPDAGNARRMGASRTGPDDFWADYDWLWCRDQVWRPIKSGLVPLVDGLSKGVGRGGDRRAIKQRLKGYGNAIVIPQAVEFIRAVMGIAHDA